MTTSETTAAYAAYAELEAAAEAFYAAATKMGQVLPGKANMLNQACEDLNLAIVEIDVELDEVI